MKRILVGVVVALALASSGCSTLFWACTPWGARYGPQVLCCTARCCCDGALACGRGLQTADQRRRTSDNALLVVDPAVAPGGLAGMRY